MMSNQVRRTCASFPAQARELVLKNGVEFEAFQALLDKAERNPMYRWKLARAGAGGAQAEEEAARGARGQSRRRVVLMGDSWEPLLIL